MIKGQINNDQATSVPSRKVMVDMNKVYKWGFFILLTINLFGFFCWIIPEKKSDNSISNIFNNFVKDKTGSSLNDWLEAGKQVDNGIARLRASDDAKARKWLQKIIEYDNSGKKWGKATCREAFRQKQMLADQGARDFLARMIEANCLSGN